MAVSLLGYTDAALLDDVVDALAAGDGATVFRVVDRVIESGHDPRRFVEDLLERLRDLLVVAAVPGRRPRRPARPRRPTSSSGCRARPAGSAGPSCPAPPTSSTRR